MRILCVSRYVNQARGLVYAEGDEFNADEEEVAYLMNDSPGSFKALDSPPANKAILDAPESKAIEDDGHLSDDLTAISGISDARQRQLQFAGIYTYADLAEADVGTLIQLHGVGEATADEWKEAAASLADSG